MYYCQNRHADVVAIVTDTGALVEQARYSSYGVPFGLPAGDADSDGDVDTTDTAIIQIWAGLAQYDVRGDLDLDGDVDSSDGTTATAMIGTTLGRGVLSRDDVQNRCGYAGYRFDEAVMKYHVRNRVSDPWLGRWITRDPIEYNGGTLNLYEYCASSPEFYMDPEGLDFGVSRREFPEYVDECRRQGINPTTGTPINKKPEPTFKNPPGSVPEALFQGAVEGFYCWCEGFTEAIFFGLVDVDMSPYLYDPTDPNLADSKGCGNVSAICLMSAAPGAGARGAGYSGRIGWHTPHHRFKGKCLPHIQCNIWRPGVPGSGRTPIRIPLPRWLTPPRDIKIPLF